MKRNYCLSLVLLALFGVSAPFAANAAVESVLSSQSTQQAKKITGKVLDAAGEPIIGASVLVKGSGTGAVTDIDGNFSVEAPVGSTLEVSFIGYKTVTLKVTNATTYTVSLQDDSQALDEVVVTAMGIKKERKALGYSMEDVKSDELMKMKTLLFEKCQSYFIPFGESGRCECYSVIRCRWCGRSDYIAWRNVGC